MGPSSLSVVVSTNALCSFSCIPGLSLPFCFPTDLVITAACSWKSFPARNEKRKIFYLIKFCLANKRKVKFLFTRAPRLRFFTTTSRLNTTTLMWGPRKVLFSLKRRFPFTSYSFILRKKFDMSIVCPSFFDVAMANTNSMKVSPTLLT